MLKDYRKQASSVIYIALQMLLFYFQRSHQYQLETARSWLVPFAATSDNLLWWKGWVDVLVYSVILTGSLCLGIAAIVHESLRVRLKEAWNEERERLFGVEAHRTLLFFATQVIQIMTVCWVLHVVFGLQFKIQTDDVNVSRTLSGLEFAYFFISTYITGGLGDVAPAGDNARVLVIFINLLTLLSVIYWFNALGRGPRAYMARRHISAFYKAHYKRLKDLAELAQSLKLNEPSSPLNGLLICPAGHKLKVGANKSCRCCHGRLAVTPEKAIAYAAWPVMKLVRFAARTRGISEGLLKQRLSKA